MSSSLSKVHTLKIVNRNKGVFLIFQNDDGVFWKFPIKLPLRVTFKVIGVGSW